MIRDNDLLRLSDLSQQVAAPCSEDFRKAVDALAGRVVTLGLLKATLTCETGDKPVSIKASAILARWLGSQFPKLRNVIKLNKGSISEETNSAICRALVQDLLAIDDVALWRAIDEETLWYMAQFKLYTKSVVEPDKKKKIVSTQGEG